MTHLWVWFTSAVWPNIVASAVWVWPALVWHHVRIGRRLDAIHRRVAATGGRATPPTGGGPVR